MPAKNIVKTYRPNSFYHIYNRGFNKQIIFRNDQDYGVFLGYIKEILNPPPKQPSSRTITINQSSYQTPRPTYQNYSKSIKLQAYCLMSNHYHLLVKQIPKQAIDQFIKSLIIRYTIYFNKRYKRQGSLFGSRYKAVLINDPEQLLYVSKYIHLNPLPKKPTRNLSRYLANKPSSYSDYLKLTNTSWLHTGEILKLFKNSPKTKFYKYKSYQQFVQNLKDQPDHSFYQFYQG